MISLKAEPLINYNSASHAMGIMTIQENEEQQE